MRKLAQINMSYNGEGTIDTAVNLVLEQVMGVSGEILPGFPKFVEGGREKRGDYEFAFGYVVAVYTYEELDGNGFPDSLD